MAEGITIPSPSVFLNSSPPPIPPPAPRRPRQVRRPTQPKRTQVDTGKPKQSKSRNGCATCKAKRLKCDEEKPGCQQCAKRNIECGGYKKDFKWRPFEETNVKSNIEKRLKATSPPKQKSSTPSTATPQSDHVATPDKSRPAHTRTDSAHQQRSVEASAAAPVQSEPVISADPMLDDDLAPPSAASSLQHGFFDDFSQSLDDLPFEDVDLLPLDEPTIDLPPGDDVVEEIDRSFSGDTASSDLSPDFWDLPLLGQPLLLEDSPEMLSLRFENLTCGILSVMDGPSENPWRVSVWPLAMQSPALYHAVSAMTAFHSSNDVPQLRIAGHEHKQASIQFIQEGIRDNSMSVQTAIATALALGFAESWDQHTASGNTHIKGAQALVKRALRDHRKTPLQGADLARLKFLCNAWVYMDVIARLTSVDSDESNDFDSFYLFSADGSQTQRQGQGFGIDFGIGVDARLDPLMGCAGTLFPVIGRVANLVRKVCRSQINSPAIISQGSDLKAMLESWECPAFIETPEDPSTQVMHSIQTAEAYRWATLLHLHQSVPEIPTASSADLARKVLSLIATVPLTSRAVIVHIYPLMVAGCEAWTLEDRQWVRDRWAAMGVRMRIGVIDKCAAVTEEVWRRRDAYEQLPETQRKLVATAELQESRDKPRRAGTPVLSTEPGRSGVVFTWIEDESSDKSKWPKRQSPKHVIGTMDPAYTVRGHLHWVGVMWDWGWEVLLG